MTGDSHPVLSVRALSRSLGADSFTLDVATVELHAGSGIAVVGESGSGKSTLLGLLALALAPDRAERFVLHPTGMDPTDLAGLWRARRLEALARLRGRHIGFMPQTGLLLPFLSLGANIALPLKIIGTAPGNRPARLATQFGIGHLLDRRPHEVSVGQRQRAALARAMITEPALVLADEPTGALHPTQAAHVLKHLVATTAETGAALIVATHDETLARAVGLPVARLVPAAGEQTRSRFAWSQVAPATPAACVAQDS